MENTMGNNALREQVKMHTDFFDKCQFAIDNGFYLEAVFLEYSSIESRLEVICGVLGLPCNKNLSPTLRKSIIISSRIACINKIRNSNCEVFKKSKIDKLFFTKKGTLMTWIDNRNIYVHGLYKNAEKYNPRKKGLKQFANEGELITRHLYNEAKRLRRLKEKSPELFDNINCPKKSICFEER